MGAHGSRSQVSKLLGNRSSAEDNRELTQRLKTVQQPPDGPPISTISLLILRALMTCDPMTECALCNATSGVRSELAIEGSAAIEIVLCDACRNDLVAESWIECTGIAEVSRPET